MEGVYICITITQSAKYVGEYRLEAILGADLQDNDNSTKVLESYKFRGVDDKLINEILKYGYFHEPVKGSWNSIPSDIRTTYLTLVFERSQNQSRPIMRPEPDPKE